MTGPPVMLQKKLHELETELADVFRLPLDPTTSDARHQMSFDDVENRFIFLDNFLSAEVSSQPQTSDQLHEIGQRLSGLKAAFLDWNQSRIFSFSNLDDTQSVCSDCTQALLNDEVWGSPISEGEKFSGQKSPEKLDSLENEETASKEDAAGEERIWGKAGKYCGVFGCGMIIGAISVVKLFSSSRGFVQYENLGVPPT